MLPSLRRVLVMTSFEMYLFTRVDKIIDVSQELSVILGIAVIISFIMLAIAKDESSCYVEDGITGSKLVCLISTPLFCISLLTYVLVPTQKELAAIMIVPKILSSENMVNLTKIGSNGIDIVKLATEYTKETLEERVKK